MTNNNNFYIEFYCYTIRLFVCIFIIFTFFTTFYTMYKNKLCRKKKNEIHNEFRTRIGNTEYVYVIVIVTSAKCENIELY